MLSHHHSVILRRRRNYIALIGLALLLETWSALPSHADILLTPLRKLLVNTATKWVSKGLNGSVEIGKIEGSLLSSPILKEVKLLDVQGNTVVHIDEIRLAYDLKTLIHKKLEVSEVVVLKPQLTLVQGADGQLNLSDAIASTEPAEPSDSGSGLRFALIINQIVIQNGSLNLNLPALAGVQEVTDIQARLSARLDEAGVRADFRTVTAHAQPANVTLQTVQGVFESLADGIRIRDVRLQTGQSTILAHGVFPGKTRAADLTVQLHPLDVGEMGRLLQDETLTGQVQLDFQASGPPEALQLNGQVLAAEGRVDLHSQLNLAATPLHYSGNLDIAHVNLAKVVHRSALASDLNLTLRLEGQGVSPRELNGRLQLELQSSHLGDIQLRPSQIHLDVSEQRVEVQRFDVDTTVARMTASGILDLAGHSDLTYALHADLAGFQGLADTKALAGMLELQGEARGAWPALGVRGSLSGRDLRYQDNRLRTLNVTYEGAQLGSQPRGSVRLLAERADVAATPVQRVQLDATYDGERRRAQFTAEAVQASDHGGTLSGSVAFQEAVQQIVIDTLQLRLPGRTWQAPEPLQIELALQPQHVRFQQVYVTHGDESIRLTGAIEGDVLQDVRLQAERIELSYWRRFLPPSELLAGRANLDLQVAGGLAQPRVQGELDLRRESPQQLPFEQVRTTVAYHETRWQSTTTVRQSDRDVMTLDLRLPIDLALTGVPVEQRLIHAPVEVQLVLDRPQLKPVSRWLSSSPPLSGALQGAVRLQGDYAKLALAANVDLRQIDIADTVQQLNAPIRLTAAIVTADSVAALVRDIRQGRVTPEIRDVAFRVPAVQGHLVKQDKSSASFNVRDVVLQASGKWTPEGPQATLKQLHLRASGLGMPPTDLNMAAVLTPQRLNLTRLHVKLPPSAVQGDGHLTFSDQHMQVRLDIPHLRLDALPFGLPPHLPPVVQGTVTASGRLHKPQIQADLQYAGGTIQADLAAHWQEPEPRYEATLDINKLDVAQVVPDASGRVQAKATLKGSGLDGVKRRATLALEVDSVGLSLAPGLSARLQALIVGDTLRVNQFRLTSAPVDVRANGALSGSRETTLDYTLTLGDLSALHPYVRSHLQATGRLTGTVRGPLDDLRTEGTLNLQDWRYASIEGKSLQSHFAVAQTPTSFKATLTGQMAEVQGPSLPLSTLEWAGRYTGEQGTFQVAVVEGPYAQSRMAGHVQWDQGQQITIDTLRLHHRELDWTNAEPIRVVRSPQGKIDLQPLQLRDGSQELRVRGTLIPSGPVQAEVHAQQVQVGPILKAAAWDHVALNGQLGLDLTVRGTLSNPQAQSQLRVDGLQWRTEPLGELRAEIGVQDEIVHTHLNWEHRGRELLQAQGTLGVTPKSPLDLRFQANRVDLARLAPLHPEVAESAGTLGFDLKLDGPLRRPQIHGNLDLNDGVLRLRAMGERYHDIQAHLAFAGDRITIEQLQVGSRSGAMRLAGDIDREGTHLRHVNVTLKADEFTAVRTPTIETQLSSALQVQGTLQDLLATGTVTVHRARYRFDSLPGSGPRAVQPRDLTVDGVYGSGADTAQTLEGTLSRASADQVPLPFLRTDIAVDIPRNAWVQGPGTAIEVNGQVNVEKDLHEPFLLSGTITTERGFASFYGKKFDIETGEITFTGSPDINPFLNVAATYDISDYRITIQIDERVRKPKLTLSSEPELPQADIVSLLLLGKTTDRLTGSEQKSFSDYTGQIAGGLLAKQLEETIGEPLGLDTIEIEAGDTLGTGSISVGRYVTQDLFLSYTREFGDEDSNIAGVEYSLKRNLKLKGESSDQGEAAFQFLWEHNY
jgi:autotransporter translocation and assembly factor TamB